MRIIIACVSYNFNFNHQKRNILLILPACNDRIISNIVNDPP